MRMTVYDVQDELNHIDAARALRMGSFGLLFYGPYQHWWYKLLGQQWPSRSTSHFLTKVEHDGATSQAGKAASHLYLPAQARLCLQVALNQLVLGPLVLSVVFTWNLLLQKKGSELQGKLKRDLVPTMINGMLHLGTFDYRFSFAVTHIITLVSCLQVGSSGSQQHL